MRGAALGVAAHEAAEGQRDVQRVQVGELRQQLAVHSSGAVVVAASVRQRSCGQAVVQRAADSQCGLPLARLARRARVGLQPRGAVRQQAGAERAVRAL